MMCITDLSNEEQVQELREVIKHCVECNVDVSLKQFVKKPDGSFNSVDLQNVPCEVKTRIDIDGDEVYIELTTNERVQLMQIVNLWKTKLKRGTQRFMSGKTVEERLNDYVMVIDLIKTEFENNLMYHLSIPDVMWLLQQNDGSLMICFKISEMFFGVESVTLQEIEYEAEVMEQESGYGYIDSDSEYDDEEDEDEVENEDFIGNDEYTRLS